MKILLIQTRDGDKMAVGNIYCIHTVIEYNKNKTENINSATFIYSY